MEEPGDSVYVQSTHTPPHLFSPGATYFVTATTLYGQPFLEPPRRRGEIIDALRFASDQRRWKLVAWVALPNHYHCIVKAPETDASALSALFKSAHRYTAGNWNEAEGRKGRVVWYRFWDTCLTYPRSFWARVNYIHYNPVKHGLVSRPEDYPYSSYHLWKRMEEIDLVEIEGTYPWDWLDLEK